MLSAVLCTLLTASHPVRHATVLESLNSTALPSHQLLLSLPAKPSPLVLRPDQAITFVALGAMLPCIDFATSGTSVGRYVVLPKPPLLSWRTHLPRSQPDHPSQFAWPFRTFVV